MKREVTERLRTALRAALRQSRRAARRAGSSYLRADSGRTYRPADVLADDVARFVDALPLVRDPDFELFVGSAAQRVRSQGGPPRLGRRTTTCEAQMRNIAAKVPGASLAVTT
jgi:hypothetical protein